MAQDGRPGTRPGAAAPTATSAMESLHESQPSTAPAPQERKKRRFPSITEYVLVATVMGALGVMAVPQKQQEQISVEGSAAARQVELHLQDFREAVVDYRVDHGVFPGYTPGAPNLQMHGPTSKYDLRAQLTAWTDVWGASSFSWMPRFEYGPYMLYGMPENPRNGLASVTLVDDGVEFPAEADGRTGWIYKPETGEVRLNAMGEVPGAAGVRWFDL